MLGRSLSLASSHAILHSVSFNSPDLGFEFVKLVDFATKTQIILQACKNIPDTKYS